MTPSLEELRAYFLGERDIREVFPNKDSTQAITASSRQAGPPAEHRYVGTHPTANLLLARLDEDPTFYRAFPEQQQGSGVFVQGNRFFRGSESVSGAKWIPEIKKGS